MSNTNDNSVHIYQTPVKKVRLPRQCPGAPKKSEKRQRSVQVVLPVVEWPLSNPTGQTEETSPVVLASEIPVSSQTNLYFQINKDDEVEFVIHTKEVFAIKSEWQKNMKDLVLEQMKK